jgi:hypothetical protein
MSHISGQGSDHLEDPVSGNWSFLCAFRDQGRVAQAMAVFPRAMWVNRVMLFVNS